MLDEARIFADPLAARILGHEFEAALADGRDTQRRPLRLFIALRSRIAEEAALSAIADGARQVVVLGAGLDTFGCRAAPIEGLRVFEVDHPDTQAEKRRRLAATEIPVPEHLVFAPCDFERQSLGDALGQAGFDERRRTVFMWLGVTPYLTKDAVEATLRYVSGLSGGAEIVFDYANPPQAVEADATRAYHQRMATRVAGLGESFRCY